MPRSTRKCALATAAALLVAAVLVTASAGAGGTGLGPKDQPSPLSISADGRCVAFASEARRLVPGDTNRCWDVFVYDSRTRQTERVSVSSKGEQANGNSWRPSVSGDGRYVAFESGATNLVPGDTNGHYDVFVRDRQTRRTTRASLGAQGAQGNDDSYVPSVSAGGRYVAFYSEASNLAPGEAGEHGDVFLHDGETGATERVSVTSTGGPAKGWSWYPAVSADGRYVAFSSTAPDLVAQDTNGQADVFVRDRQTGATERISVSSAGLQANGRSGFVSISGDGQYVAFDSDASNLVPGDTNGHLDVFVYDRRTRTTERVSVSSHGAQGHSASAHPSLSADGRYVAFSSYASNLVPDTWGIFVHDRRTGTTEHVSTMPERGHRYYEMPAISADGRYIAFLSETVDRGPGWSDSRWGVFVRDRRLSTAERIDRPGGRGVGSFLLRLLLYWRDDTGQWVPMPWHARLTLAALLLMASWFLWEGITKVRRGKKSGWRMIWWAVAIYPLLLIGLSSHGYPVRSPQWIAIKAAMVAAWVAWAVVGFRKGYPLRGDEDGETEAALDASAAVEEPPGEERSARERLHDRARAVQGEAARRRTEPWRRLSRVCCAAWRLSLQVLLFSGLAACVCAGLGMLWGDPDVLWPWFVRALVWQACVAGFAGLVWLAARAADWRLARELDRLEPPRADTAG